MSKKILLTTTHFYPYKGGLENFALELAKGLTAKKNVVNVLTFQDKNLLENETYEGITINRIPGLNILGNTYTLPVFNKKYRENIEKIINSDYDVIITNTRFFIMSYLGMIIAKKINKKKNKTKFIHIEHGNVHVVHKNPIITLLAWIYDQTLGRIIFRNADLVVGISKQCVTFAKKMGAKKTKLIYNSINLSEYKKINTDLRKKLNISPNKKIVTYVGRLIYAKGVQDLINAASDIKNIQLIIIGEGPHRKELEKIALKTKQKVIFTGQLNKKEIIEYLSITDIFVNPSYSEGLPTSVLEAAAMGLPIIATDVGGTKEIIKQNLVKPRNIKELKSKLIILTSKNKKQKTKTRQYALLSNFDINKNINKFEEIL